MLYFTAGSPELKRIDYQQDYKSHSLGRTEQKQMHSKFNEIFLNSSQLEDRY